MYNAINHLSHTANNSLKIAFTLITCTYCRWCRCSTRAMVRGRRWAGQFRHTSADLRRHSTTTKSSSSAPTSAACLTRRRATGQSATGATVAAAGPGSATSGWSSTTDGYTCSEADATTADSMRRRTRWRESNWWSSVTTAERWGRATGIRTLACRDLVSSPSAVYSIFRRNFEAGGDSLTYAHVL